MLSSLSFPCLCQKKSLRFQKLCKSSFMVLLVLFIYIHSEWYRLGSIIFILHLFSNVPCSRWTWLTFLLNSEILHSNTSFNSCIWQKVIVLEHYHVVYLLKSPANLIQYKVHTRHQLCWFCIKTGSLACDAVVCDFIFPCFVFNLKDIFSFWRNI